MRYFCEACGSTTDTNVPECFKCKLASTKHQQSAAKAKVETCRTNRCGHYVADSDACQLVIDRGKAKGQSRPGKIAWLYANPSATCPATPPQF